MLNEFLAKNPVFRLDEIDAFLSSKGSTSRATRNSLLAYYRRKDRLLRVRRGLYAVVPPGLSPETAPMDPFLLASKMTSDAVLAYHTALEYHGKAYSVFTHFFYLSNGHSVQVRFRSYEFRCVSVRSSLRTKGREDFGVDKTELRGVTVRVTSLERTLVDVLDRPRYAGGWEETWRSLESVEFFDLDKVVEYALLLENATTAAKVGFFLEQHREELMVTDKYLKPLRESRPRQPHYLDRSVRTSGNLVPAWNLVVPVEVLERTWEEVL